MGRRAAVLTGLLAAVVGYRVLPLTGFPQQLLYDAIAVAAMTVAWVALVRRRPDGARAWALLLLGHTLWVVGDVLWALEEHVWVLEAYPAPSDVPYIAGYVVLVAGLVRVASARAGRRDTTALLDASIVAVGAGIPAVAFVVAPAAMDSTMTWAGRLVTIAYPFGTLLVLAFVLRLVLASVRRSAASVLLLASLGTTLVADAWWTAVALEDPDAWPITGDTLWLLGFALLAAATLHPSMRDVTRTTGCTSEEVRVPGSVRLALLTAASLLPAATLVVAGLRDAPLPWAPIAVGMAVMAVLVMARTAGLVRRVQEQSAQLAALARQDDLTGAPNRRSFDHELLRACDHATATGNTLSVAMVDLDHFKHFNDTYGHPAGDVLLRDAVAAWSAALGGRGVVARYGGEEFAVVLPVEAPEAVALVDRLRLATPGGQTLSAGLAAWAPGVTPTELVAAADDALYRAKRAGRDRVEVAGPVSPGLPSPRTAAP